MLPSRTHRVGRDGLVEPCWRAIVGQAEDAAESYAETIVKQGRNHGRNQQHIEYLCKEFIRVDYGFASGYDDDALRILNAFVYQVASLRAFISDRRPKLW